MEIERIVRMEWQCFFFLKLVNVFGSFKSWSCRAVIKLVAEAKYFPWLLS